MEVEDESIKMDDGENEVGRTPNKRGRKPGRKTVKSDMKVKLERSRQSARECRARKKLRYQYLEDLANTREKAVLALYQEIDQYRQWAKELDDGRVPEGLAKMLEDMKKNCPADLDPSAVDQLLQQQS